MPSPPPQPPIPAQEPLPDSRHRAFCAATALIGWLGLGLQLYLAIPARIAAGHSLSSAIVWYFSFFTILTNLAAAASMSLISSGSRSRWSRWASTPSAQTGITVSIALVGIAYELLLRGIWKPAGLTLVADTILHDIVPALYLIHWTLYVPKGRLRWPQLPTWLLYPAAYLAYALVRGALTGQYPYYFLDVGELGYARTSLSITMLLAGTVCIGAALLGIDRWLGNRRKERETS